MPISLFRFVKAVCLLVFMLLLGGQMTAQNFPVRSSVTLVTPSAYLEDYGRGNNLLVTLVLVDTRPEYDGLLRLTITGDNYRLVTSEALFMTPITLRRGQPLILRGSRLADYFNINNLRVEGAGGQAILENGGALPDGPITICAEFYDLNRFNEGPVSAGPCATRFVQQNYPPELVRPLGQIPEVPTNVVNFSWNPRHVPQPLDDEYELTVWEKIEGLTYDQIINSTGPVRDPILTMIPRYTFTNYDTPLEVGQEYIWRVQVRDRRNVREFLNFGYSDYGEFRYGKEEDPGGACPGPQRLFAQGVTSSGAEIGWAMETTDNLGGFALRYRPVGGEGWVDAGSVAATATSSVLRDLQPGTNYEAELCAICTDGNRQCDFVPFLTLTTSEDCGPLPTPVTVPLAEDVLRLSWPTVEQATAYRISWAPIIAPSSPVPVRDRGGRQRETPRGMESAPGSRTLPGTGAPSPPSASADSLLLPAGSTEANVFGLLSGTDYTFSFCKICPDGTEECFSWTVDFNGIDDDCLTGLNFTRPDSTETTLDLAWTYNPAAVAANDSFTLIWQVSDRTLPEMMVAVAYTDGSYTITDRIPGQTYTLQVCAECTAGEPVCEELAPFGGCPADYSPQLVDLDRKYGLLGFDTTGVEPVPFEWRYAMRSFGNWSPLTGGNFSNFNPANYSIPAAQLAETPKLRPMLVYAAQIRNVCYDTLWSAWSEPVEFSTSCRVVDTLSASAITDSSALITAVPVASAAYYQYFYRLAGSSDWTLVDQVQAPSLPLVGLLADTTYEVKMRFWCTLGVWSDETDILTFSTLPPCGQPLNAGAYALEATAAGLSWEAGENALQTTLRYKRAGGFFSPWQVVENLADSVWLADLRGGARYRYRLQSDCEVNRSAWTSIDTFTLLCAPPNEVAVSNLTYESAQVNIGGLSPTAGDHEYSYRLLGDSVWLLLTANSSQALLENLNDLSTYELRVRTRCQAGQYSVWSDTLQFDVPVKCLVPENLGVSALTSSSADIRWDVTGTVSTWEIRFYDPAAAVPMEQQQAPGPATERGGGVSPGGGTSPGSGQTSGRTPSGTVPGRGGPPSGGTTPNTTGPVSSQPGSAGASEPLTPPNPYASWQVMTTTDPEKFFSSLRSNTAYKVVIRAECPTFGWTDYSEVLEFRTLCPAPAPDNLAAENILETEARLEWSRIFACLEEYSVTVESLLPIMGGNTGTSTSSNEASQTRGGGAIPGRTSPGGGGTTIGQGGPTMFRDSTTVTDEFVLFTGLQANTEYRFRVRGRVRQSLYDPPPPGYLTMADWVLLGAAAGAEEITGEAGWSPYSPWFTFRTDHCAQPYDIIETPINRSTIEISWTPSNGVNDYEFKYKLADDAGSSWAFLNVTEPVVVLESLLSNAIYDYQITELCQDGMTTRPAPQDTFLMKRPSINNGYYVCGMLVDVDLSNEIPLPELFKDDTIRAFDFPVVITQASGGGGIFSGEGEIRIPYFNKAKMKFVFEGIFINDEYQMVGGYMEATGFGIEVLPPWADTLLSGIITGLEMLDDMLQDQQVDQLDSLLMCCSDAIPDGLQDQMQAIVDCFDAVDEANTPAFDSCEAMMDTLLLTIQDDLQEIIDSLEEEIIISKTIDLIRLALDTLKVIHEPGIEGEESSYTGLRDAFASSYNLAGSSADPPPLPSNMTLEVKSLPCADGTVPIGSTSGNTQLAQFRTDAVAIRDAALTLTEHDLYATLTTRIPPEPRRLIKEFAEVIRGGDPEDKDVFALTRALVEGLGENQDPETLIPQVMVLVGEKINYLVRN